MGLYRKTSVVKFVPHEKLKPEVLEGLKRDMAADSGARFEPAKGGTVDIANEVKFDPTKHVAINNQDRRVLEIVKKTRTQKFLQRLQRVFPRRVIPWNWRY